MSGVASQRRARRGFTLLEVIISTSILVVALAILVQTQWTAAQMTMEADRIVVATQLAQEKLAEVRMRVEREGFTDQDVTDDGDFRDFGDDAVNVEFADLSDYRWEYLITPVDLELATDLSSTANNLMGALGGPTAAAAGAPPVPDLSSFGFSPEMLTDALDPFIREVRVRVWWGKDADEAETLGNEVVITTHVINPAPNILGRMRQPNIPGGGRPGGGGPGGPGGGGPGGGGPGGMRPGGMQPGGGVGPGGRPGMGGGGRGPMAPMPGGGRR